ncbi:DUF2341 domain-containing protein, partial [Halieaceae bacterium IMCC14734]
MKRKPVLNNENRFQLELLEPRLLFSADWGGVFAPDVNEDPDYNDGGIDSLPKVLPLAIAQQQAEPRHELVIVDTQTPDHELMLSDIYAQQSSGRTLDVLLLDSERDGIEQISEALAGYDSLDAIHIVSHAEDGAVQLGDGWLDAATLNAAGDAIGNWSHALDEGADLLFYGCDLAASDTGVSLLQSLAGMTGADVAASTDRTGASELGGDWIFEYVSGDVETELAFSSVLQARFDNVLAPNSNPYLVGLNASHNYTEGDGPLVLDSSLTIGDVELNALDGGNGNYAGLVVTLARAGGPNAEDVFGFNNGGGETVSGNELLRNGNRVGYWDTGVPGQLTMTFTDDNGSFVGSDHFSHYFERITYQNAGSLPTGGIAIEWTVTDGNTGSQGTGGVGSVTGSVSITTLGFNDAPTLGNAESVVTLIENTGGVALYAAVEVIDAELDSYDAGVGNYAGAQFSIARSGAPNAEDLFSFSDGNGISLVGNELHKAGSAIASFDTSVAGSLMITYTDANGQNPTAADVDAIQRQIIYDTANDMPQSSVLLDWSLTDGNAGTEQGNGGAGVTVGSTTVAIIPRNDAPVFNNLDDTPIYAEGGTRVLLDTDVSITDAETDTLNGGNGDYDRAVLTLARSGASNAEDVFGFVDGPGITLSGSNLIKNLKVIGTFDTTAPGQLTVTFTSANGEIATTADVTTVARQITYLNTSEAAATSVQIDWSMQDAVDNSWWHHDWSERVELTFDNLASFEDLEDFPVLLRLTGSDVDFDLIRNGGADIRFVDGDGTLLEYEIESWNDTTETATVWVRVPTIDQLSNTDSITMYFGNPSAGSVSVPANVWATDYVGVWHLGETVTDEQVGGVHVDSASGFNGTQHNNDDTLGQIGTGQAFDDKADVITVGDYDALTFTDGLNDKAFSMSAWISPEQDDGVIFGKLNGEYEYELFIENEDLAIALYDTAGDYIGIYTTDKLPLGSWQYVTATYDGSGAMAGLKLYIDGTELTGGELSAWSSGTYDGMSNTGEAARIGGYSEVDDQWDFDGEIDEVRVSNTVRSADWVEASWLSQRSGASFVSFGAVERSQDAGGIATGTGAITVTIATENDAPLLSGLDATPTYVEGLTPVILDSTVSIADIELDTLNNGDGDYSGASLTLSRAVTVSGDDVFSFVAGNDISQLGNDLLKNGNVIASFDVSTPGQLLLTFTNANGEIPTTADVNAIAGQIAYSNSSDVPPASVQVDWTFSDGNVLAQGSGGALQDSGSITVQITAQNDAPVFTSLDDNPTFRELPPPFVSFLVQFDVDVSISDPELDALNGGLGNYAGATLTIARDGGRNPDDYFFILTDNGITFDGANLNKGGSALASFDRSVPGQLTITFNTATTAEVNDVLRQTLYGNSNELAPASVDMELTFNDGNILAQGQGSDASTSGIVTVNIQNYNELPVFGGLDALPGFIEDTSAIVMDSNVSISDVELDVANNGNGDYNGASLKLVRAVAANSDDVFGFVDGNGITLDSGNLVKNGQVIASFDTSVAGELTITYTNGNGETPTTADATAIARQLTYSNSSDLPPAGVQIDWEFNDGVAPGWGFAGVSAVNGSVNIAITSINEDPTLNGLDATPTFIEDQAAVVLDSSLAIADPELDSLNGGSGDYNGATLTLVRDLAANPDDIFGFNAGSGISLIGSSLVKNGQSIASFDTSVAGQLSITYTNANGETPTTADINAIAQQLTYSNSSDLPPTHVHINWTFSDGNVTGQGVGGVLTANSSMTVALVGINETPGFTNLNATPTFSEGGVAVVLDPDVVLVDKELDGRNGGSGNYSGAVLSLVRTGGANAEDIFGFNNGNGISLVGSSLLKNGEVIASFDTSVAGRVDITFTRSNGEIPNTADAVAIARQITYSNSSEAPETSVSIDWTLDDGGAPAWMHQDWEERVEISLDNLASSEELNDFPVLIKLNGLDIDFDTIAANGADLRFTDVDGEVLSYEIDSWDDVAETGAVWVKVTHLEQNSDSNFIYMYHNNPDAADDQDAAQVWTDSLGVWHLDEDPGPGLADQILDSAGTANHGTAGASHGTDDSVGGNVGDAIKFDAIGDHIGVGATDLGSSFTIEAWIKPDSAHAGSMTIIANTPIGSDMNGFRFFFRGDAGNPDDGQLRFETGNTLTSNTGTSLAGVIDFDQWNHVAVEVDRDAGWVRIYHNGVDVTDSNTVLTGFSTNSDFDIGQMEGGGFDFSGSIDELRIANVARSADWIEASYLSQSSGFAFASLGSALSYTDFADNKSVTQANSVIIAGVNDQPGMVGLDASPNFTEDQPAIVMDSSVTITDLELDSLNGGNGDYTGASLTLARNITANPDDVFGFVDDNGISLSGSNLLKGGDIIASFDTSVAGELTITFTNPTSAVATTADVNAIAQQLTYSNTNDQPPVSVQIDWDLSDGNVTDQGSGGPLGASGSITIGITSANENPTFSGLDGAPTFIEDQAAVILDSDVTIADPELDSLNGGNGDYTGASLTLARNLAANPEDVFGFATGNGISLSGGNLLKGGDIIASFDTSVAGELTITFASPATAVATTADVNAIAQQLTYSNTNDLPPASVQINWDLSDGNGTAQGTGGAL